MRPIKWSRSHVQKILMIKMRYIGDTVLVTPLIKAFKTAMPRAQIDLLLNKETAGIVKGHPQIDNILAFDYDRSKKDYRYFIKFLFDIRSYGYDMVLDLTRNDRSALFTFVTGAPYRIGYEGASFFQQKAYTHQVSCRFGEIHTVDHHLQMARSLGLPANDPHPDLTVSNAGIQRIRTLIEEAGLNSAAPYVLIHPGARRWYKSWPPDRFARIADVILKHYPVQVVLSGGPGDEETCKTIASQMRKSAFNLCGRIQLDQLPALIGQSALLIGNDSAPIHIATAVKTPVVALFGPTKWEAWQPRRTHDKILSVAYSCRPCGHSRPDCPLGDTYCMSTITVEKVWETIQNLFSTLRIEPKG